MGAPRKIVLGLGNPGTEYDGTRHNVGFELLDRIAAARGLRWVRCGWLRPVASIARDETMILAKPRTFMNRSGDAAVFLCRRFSIPASEVVVAYDDADLPLGRIKIRPSGGSGGHNGIGSLVRSLGNAEFARLRLGVRGVGRAGSDLAEYVLSPFLDTERKTVDEMLQRAAAALKCVVTEGVERAMNRFNDSRPAAVHGGDQRTNS